VNKKLSALLLSVLVSLITCQAGKSAVPPSAELTADEYGVFSAYIAGKFTGQKDSETGKDITKIVILNTSSPGDQHYLSDENGQRISWEGAAESLRKRDPALQQATIVAFEKMNARQALVRRSFHLAIDYELIDPHRLSFFSKRMALAGPDFTSNIRVHRASRRFRVWGSVRMAGRHSSI
jgi:hypothetical protein